MGRRCVDTVSHGAPTCAVFLPGCVAACVVRWFCFRGVQYPLYSASIALYGGSQVGYELDEESGWTITVHDAVHPRTPGLCSVTVNVDWWVA